MDDEIRALIEDLKSDDPYLVEVAGNTFLKIGPEAIPPLINCLDDTRNYFRISVGKILARFGEPALDLLFREIYNIHGKEFNYGLGNLVVPLYLFGEAALNPLFELIKYDLNSGRIGTPIQVEGCDVFKKIGEPARNYLLDKITDLDPDNRTVSALCLSVFRGKEIPTALIKALTDPDEKVRDSVKSSLCDLDFVPYLEEASMNNENPELKKRIRAIMGEIERLNELGTL